MTVESRAMTVRVVRGGRKGVVERLVRASKGRGWHRRRVDCVSSSREGVVTAGYGCGDVRLPRAQSSVRRELCVGPKLMSLELASRRVS